MEGMMKAAVYHSIGNVKVEERPIPQITENDVLIKVLRAGICGSDTGAFLHGGLNYGVYTDCIFGHEFVGRVVEKGANVAEDIQIGDLVFVDPTSAKRAGLFVADICGAFGEYVSVENAKTDYNIFKLKQDVDLDAAALIEPLSVGTRGALAMNPGPEDNVVVLGAGTIGLCAAAGLINRGIKNVIVVDCIGWRLEKAAQLGARTINTAEADLGEKLIEFCGEFKRSRMNLECVDPKLFEAIKEMAIKAGIDPTARITSKTPNVALYVDCAGAVPLLNQVLGMCAGQTKYSIVAVYSKEIPVHGGVFMSEPVIRGSSGYTIETIKEVIDHLENARTPIKNIVTAKYKIDDFEEAIKAAADRDSKNIKVVIDFEN